MLKGKLYHNRIHSEKGELAVKPSIHLATDCNAPSQVQFQVSATGAHTHCHNL